MFENYYQGWLIHNCVKRVRDINHQIKVNKEKGTTERNDNLKPKVEKIIGTLIYRLRDNLAKVEGGQKYRFESQSYGAIRAAFNELCYNSRGKEEQVLEDFLGLIKDAKITIVPSEK